MLALFLLLALLLVLVGHAFRLLRWEQFIRIYERPPRGQMLRGMAGGYALNFVLPFHLGDAFRAVYTGRRMKSGIGFALATVIMDRFLDVWFVAFGFIAFRLLGLGGAPVDGAAQYYLVFSLLLVLGLVLVVALRDFLKKICLAFCGLFNDTLKLDGCPLIGVCLPSFGIYESPIHINGYQTLQLLMLCFPWVVGWVRSQGWQPDNSSKD